MENTKSGGAFQIARQIFNSELWLRKPISWKILWIYILGNVNHTKTKEFDRGEGYFDFSRDREKIDCSLTIDSTKKALVYFRKSEMISTSRSTRGIRLKVLNYDTYQTLGNYKSTSKSTNEALEKHQRSTPIQKNDKNVKNDKNENTTSALALNEHPPNEDIAFVYEIFKKHYGVSPKPIMAKGRNFDLNTACALRLVKTHTRPVLQKMLEFTLKYQGTDKYCRISTNPLDFEKNISWYKTYFEQKKINVEKKRIQRITDED